ncbi:MAG: 16S rRNA (guanine(527)-N(7))-methyltransferase RsmG [Tetrasphaera sp.]|nr:16S rRNA (guanine(527)-N(7))-methyltransferase RsmG [Tetrasphaera sp.]
MTDRMPAPAAPEGAADAFRGRLGLAERFADILADTGVSHGLIGPREVPRLWERHLLNCVAIADAMGDGPIIDVGSGAGLPGVVLAIARPDVEVHLVEPLLRRTQWLHSVVAELGLSNVTVHRARAEEVAGSLVAPIVTARAVARLDKLARWCAPLLTPGGRLVALKGHSAAQELAEDRAGLLRYGAVRAEVTEHSCPGLSDPVLTIDVEFEGGPAVGSAGSRTKAGRGKGPRRAQRARSGVGGSGRGSARGSAGGSAGGSGGGSTRGSGRGSGPNALE